MDKDAPVSRPVQPAGSIKSPPILGGVHHHYVRVSVFGTHNFNDLLVAALRSAAKRIVERNPNSPGWPVMERSIMGPYSKIWVYGDSKPFLDAPQGEFAPRRWAERTHTVWLRAPLPQHAAIDLKGTWLSDNDRSYQVDPLKADRDEEVYKKEGA